MQKHKHIRTQRSEVSSNIYVFYLLPILMVQFTKTITELAVTTL